MKSRVVLPLLLLFVALLLTTVEARELFVSATDVVAIRSSVASQDTRLLVRFPLPEVLAGKSVDFARVGFNVGCRGNKGAVSLEAFRVTTAWNAASVSWTQPWRKAGGDWDEDTSVDGVVPAGEGKPVYLDITDFVNGWLKEPSSNFGILVKVSEPFLGTFSTAAAQGLPKLRILY
jgi:hypothetical protein